jgi:competence protein ComEA
VRESIRDRLAALSRRELAALVAVGLVLLAGAALWYARSLPRPVELRAGEAPVPGPTASSSPAVIVVHVAGWVLHPGVYEFSEGDRVVDAINAAGGPKKGADLASLNLAALLTDGEQVLVPAKGAPGTGPEAPGASPGAALVNVNTATEQELEALPGIGPVLAQKIIDYRTAHGPFPTVDALDDVSGIGPATLENLRPLVTV